MADANVQTQATNLLGGIPFSNIIGGPMVAAIDAQGQAAMQTANFILSVGFGAGGTSSGTGGAYNEPLSAQTVFFSYYKTSPSGVTQQMFLEVPLLTIVPIPYIRINAMNINFTANIQADTASQTSTSSTENLNATTNDSLDYWILKSNFSASMASSSSSNASTNSTYNVQYQMEVNVSAVQDALPAGLQAVLNILSNAITPSNLPPTSSAP
jgi:hypothetical protein